MTDNLRKTILPWITASIILLSVLGISALVQNRQANPATGELTALSVAPSLPATTTGQAIATLETQVVTQSNEQSYVTLAYSYVQLVRETADTSYYERVDELLQALEQADAANSSVPALRATVALGKHDFTAGKTYAEQAITLAPAVASYYGLLADAEIELGHYAAAEQALQQMIDLEPSFGAYSRVAYFRELNGDVAGAIQAMQAALGGGSHYPENLAWANVEIGKLVFRQTPEKAQAYFALALEQFPDYPIALQWLGRVAATSGDLTQAQTYLEQAYALQPLAQLAVDLADLAYLSGDAVAQEKYSTLARITFASTAAAGTNTTLEEAQFLVPRHYNLDEAMVLAEQAYSERPNIFSADIYALALYQTGNITEAQVKIDEALRLGEREAGMVYHAGLIAEAAGQVDKAAAYYQTAYELSPYFSLIESPELLKKLKH